MNTQKQFRVLVVEDSEFFNQFITNQLKWYLGEIAYQQGCNLEIDSFRSADECLHNLKQDTDLAFIDYYLEDGKTAMEVIEGLKEKNIDCKVIILSQKRTVKSALEAHSEFPVNFIYKDDNVLHKSCFISEELLNDKLRAIN